MATIGKINRLRKCSTADGKIIMFALDHRGNLRRALNPMAPESVGYQEMAAFKLHLTSVMTAHATGILLDPEYGLAPAIAHGAIAPGCGLLVAVEKTGYTGDPHDRQSQILPGWSVEKIARSGAEGVKLLLYYHPDAPNAAAQEAIVAQVGEACAKADIPYFLEPLSFSLDPEVKKLASAEKRRVVVETARRLTPMAVDILKAEFPVNIDDQPDEAVWAEACAELSQASLAPWVLLSAGVNFEQFARQTEIACRAGASGVLAGRAVWKEAAEMEPEARDEFLRTTAASRMAQLGGIIETYGRSWTDFYPQLEAIAREGWYQQY